MNQTDFFRMLGAPLANARWSWGSVRSDGTVFLRVWEDGRQKFGDSIFVRIGRLKPKPKSKQGPRERHKHIERIKQGAPCFLVMCKTRDLKASPRTIDSFNEEQVFPGGKIIDRDGEFWIELLSAVPVRSVLQSPREGQAEPGTDPTTKVKDSNRFQRGSGFGNQIENKLVEKAAIDAVRKAYENNGWLVRSVERDKCGFDLECRKKRLIENVEVKGITATEQCFMITAGEVEQARKTPSFVLIVVTSALSRSPLLTRYSGAQFCRRFHLAAVQYRAVLRRRED